MPTKTATIPTADGLADAFVAFPDGGGTHPGVLMYSDAFGLRPVIEDMARELAGHGYYVLVPNVYYRHGPPPVVELPEHITAELRPALFAELIPLMQEHTPERALVDAEAYLGFLTSQPEVSPGPVAVTGYCMGAVLAVRTAAAHPDRVAAVGGFHPGPLVTDAPDSPHRLVGPLTAEVHLGLAVTDLAPEALKELEQAFDETGVTYSCEVYPDTVHGFTMADTDAFDADGLRLHWDRLLALLGRALPRG
ncbi:dienelactone hydrolase family protein [Umezawaea tangerina]|uniref:dienelactone hydrolase family protein n=1 Tax=Umezawaea tangerina TaxID=84725 RepID=UPI000D07FCE8|nr:dienelactone hydrolase family protein [Umezawaea tangerina]